MADCCKKKRSKLSRYLIILLIGLIIWTIISQ
jgi:hypothetical protein